MLARGDIDGIVGFRPEAVDQPAGALIAREAGMCLLALDGTPLDERIGLPESDRSFIAGSPAATEWLLGLVHRARRVEPAVTALLAGDDLGVARTPAGAAPVRPPAPRRRSAPVRGPQPTRT
jgi:hypothetical protein